MQILNLTQHPATPEQIAAGVYDAAGEVAAEIRSLLTFDDIPTREELASRAVALATLANLDGCEAAMLGGAPYLMGPLEAALREQDVQPLYAFSRRESVEEVMPDGSVRKTAVFRHAGFVRP